MAAKVLYIEDNYLNVKLVSKLMKLFGHDLVVAYDGDSGIEAAARENPDVILMDIHLPDMSGIDITAGIKSHPVLGKIPIIALTADDGWQTRDACHDAGVDAYLSKPVSKGNLLRTLQQFVG